MSSIKIVLPVLLLLNGLCGASYVGDLTDYNTDPEIFAGILSSISNRDLDEGVQDSPIPIWSFARGMWDAIENLEKQHEQKQIKKSQLNGCTGDYVSNNKRDLDLIIMKAEKREFSDSGEESSTTDSPYSIKRSVSHDSTCFYSSDAGLVKPPSYYNLSQLGSNPDFLVQVCDGSFGDTCESTCCSVGPYSDVSIIIDDDEDEQRTEPEFNTPAVDTITDIGMDIEPEYVLISDKDLNDPSLLESIISTNVQTFIGAPKNKKQLLKYDQNILSVISNVLTKVTRLVFFHDLLANTLTWHVDAELYPLDHAFDELCREYDMHPYQTKVPFDSYPPILRLEDLHGRLQINPENIISLDDYNYSQDILYFSDPKSYNQINVDLPRLAEMFVNAYQSNNNISDMTKVHREKLNDEMLSLLSYILVTKKPEDVQFSEDDMVDLERFFEVETTEDVDVSTPDPKDKVKHTLFFQGFDSIAAYFLIQYGLEPAGPLAFKFFHMYLKDFINLPDSELSNKVRNIDDQAIRIVREYMKHESTSLKSRLDVNIALGILEHYPFSHRSATVAYFSSAKTFKDLDMLVQFMIVEVPKEKAHLTISLMAAANMYFSVVAFDALFREELGKQNWTNCKIQLNKEPDSEIFSELASNYMGNIFMLYSSQLNHTGQKMVNFLDVARSFVPYL